MGEKETLCGIVFIQFSVFFLKKKKHEKACFLLCPQNFMKAYIPSQLIYVTADVVLVQADMDEINSRSRKALKQALVYL